MVAATPLVVALLVATASGLLVSFKPSHKSSRAPSLRMAESAKTLREQLLQEAAAYEATATTDRGLEEVDVTGQTSLAIPRAIAVACQPERQRAELQQIASSSHEIEPAGAAGGADRARRGAIQAFCAWAVGPLIGRAAAMASESVGIDETVTELAERLELYEARARDAEKTAQRKDAELQQKLAELAQASPHPLHPPLWPLCSRPCSPPPSLQPTTVSAAHRRLCGLLLTPFCTCSAGLQRRHPLRPCGNGPQARSSPCGGR